MPQIKIQTLMTQPDQDVIVLHNGCMYKIRCVFGKRRYEEWTYIFMEGKESNFVLKKMIILE